MVVVSLSLVFYTSHSGMGASWHGNDCTSSKNRHGLTDQGVLGAAKMGQWIVQYLTTTDC